MCFLGLHGGKGLTISGQTNLGDLVEMEEDVEMEELPALRMVALAEDGNGVLLPREEEDVLGGLFLVGID